MRSTSATPRRTSTPSSSSAAIPISRRWSRKLRENAKRVIGVGVKQSTSDLLIANCDEFIYIDDLVRKRQRDSAEGNDRQNRKSVDPQEMEERRAQGPRHGGRHARSHAGRSGRGRACLGLGAQGSHQAPQSRLQRKLLRLPHPRRDARRRPQARPARIRSRRAFQRLCKTARAGRNACRQRKTRAEAAVPPAPTFDEASDVVGTDARSKQLPRHPNRIAAGAVVAAANLHVAEVAPAVVEAVAVQETAPVAEPAAGEPETAPAKPARKPAKPRAPRRKKAEAENA